MTPPFLAALLASPVFGVFARIVMTFLFWSAGLGMAADYADTLGVMAHFGLQPAGVFAPLVIAVLLIGSLLIIANRMAWLGFGMLAVFVALTIFIAHPFWTMEGERRLAEFHVVMEHITVIGALMVGAILCRKLELERAARGG